MPVAVDTLPDDPAALKALILKEREHFERKISTLIEALQLERHRRFGTRSEKAPGQGELFDEAEQDSDVEELAPTSSSTKLVSKSVNSWILFRPVFK